MVSLNNVLVVLTFLAGLTAFADPITFTWDPSRSSPALAGPGSGFTADTINTTNYLHSVNQSNGSFVEELVLRVNSFDQNGQTVVSPGLNSSYGLYFAITGTGVGAAFTSLNIALMADPGSNDGVLGSTLSGISFANRSAGDFLLGSGSLVSASLALDSAGVRHAHFVETFAPASGEVAFFGTVSPFLEVFLTTPPANFMAVPQLDGTTIQMVNGGIGQVNLAPAPEPATWVLLGLSLSIFVLFRKRIA